MTTYAESIASRGAKNPEERARLSDTLFMAGERLANVLIDHREAIVNPLEGQPDHVDARLPMELHQKVLAGIDRYEDAAAAATRFLMAEGHTFRDEDDETLTAPVPWAVLADLDEESLADAASAVLQGSMSRQKFAEVRERVVGARARFDIAIGESVGRAGAAQMTEPEGDDEGPVGFSVAELEQMEREAVEEIAAVAQRHANRLPIRSDRRPLLIRLANLRLAVEVGDGDVDAK